MVGKWVNIYVIGVTTLKAMPASVNYKIYGLDGKNVASGVLNARHGLWNDGPKGLGASLELNYRKHANAFRLQIPIVVSAECFDDSSPTKLVNFGVDVFIQGGAHDVHEGMCVQVANAAQSKLAAAKADFQMSCKDNGDGTFTKGVVPNSLHPLRGCNEFHKQCDGCITTCNPQRAAFMVDRNPFVREKNVENFV